MAGTTAHTGAVQGESAVPGAGAQTRALLGAAAEQAGPVCHPGHAARPQGRWAKESHTAGDPRLCCTPPRPRKAAWPSWLAEGAAAPRAIPGSGSTHLAEAGRPGTGLCPRRAPRCRSSPPAWSALAGGWCTAERGPEDQALAGRGRDARLSTTAGWGQ